MEKLWDIKEEVGSVLVMDKAPYGPKKGVQSPTKVYWFIYM
jgi:hypothetical protein